MTGQSFDLIPFLISLLSASVRLAVPIMLPALGEVYAERSGIINLGTEGVMIMAALGGMVGAYFLNSIWLGFCVGMVVAVLMDLVMAFLSINLRVNQVITGFAITIVGSGLSLFLYRAIFGIRSVSPSVDRLPDWNIPLLSKIPFLGPIFFQHSPFIYIAFLLVPLAAFVLYRTQFGLAVRAVGENPEAADTKGINVFATRYTCLIIHGIMAGFGGAFLSLAFQGQFVPDMTAGRGYIALAVVILARWDPASTIWASMLFGGAYALGLRLQTMQTPIPYQLFLTLPYLITLLVLIGVARRAAVPGALAVPYSRGHKE
jgi:general nucleoside transport system permease protein